MTEPIKIRWIQIDDLGLKYNLNTEVSFTAEEADKVLKKGTWEQVVAVLALKMAGATLDMEEKEDEEDTTK